MRRSCLFLMPASGMPLIFLIASLTLSSAVMAQEIKALTVAGEYTPGIIGTYPLLTEFSWFANTLSGGGTHTWTFGPGTDGGVVFDKPQTAPFSGNAAGEMTSWFLMWNLNSNLFSVNSGIQIDTDNTIDMANLRWRWDVYTMDIGSGAGSSTLVPLLADISTLGPNANGWMLNGDGTYHLIYHADYGTCGADCSTDLHLYGNVLFTPLPAASWLFASGIIALGGLVLRGTGKG